VLRFDLNRLFREERLDDTRADVGCETTPRERIDLLDLQLQRVGRRLQGVGLLVDEVGELIGRLDEFLLRLQRPEVALRCPP